MAGERDSYSAQRVALRGEPARAKDPAAVFPTAPRRSCSCLVTALRIVASCVVAGLLVACSEGDPSAVRLRRSTFPRLDMETARAVLAGRPELMSQLESATPGRERIRALLAWHSALGPLGSALLAEQFTSGRLQGAERMVAYLWLDIQAARIGKPLLEGLVREARDPINVEQLAAACLLLEFEQDHEDALELVRRVLVADANRHAREALVVRHLLSMPSAVVNLLSKDLVAAAHREPRPYWLFRTAREVLRKRESELRPGLLEELREATHGD